MPDLEDHAGHAPEDRIASALRGLSAQAPTALPLPYETVRRRGAGRRRRRRAAVLTVVAAACAVGVLGSGAVLRGHRQTVAGPATTAPTSTPTPEPSATTGGSATAASKGVIVDLAAHTVRVQLDRAAPRTLPATAGRPGSPTPTGSMRVADKQLSVHMTGGGGPTPQPSGGGEYDLSLPWCVRLVAVDGRSTTYVCGMSQYGPSTLGHENRTFGAVGLSVEDARWFFDHLQVGDPVEVVNPEPPAPGNTPG